MPAAHTKPFSRMSTSGEMLKTKLFLSEDRDSKLGITAGLHLPYKKLVKVIFSPNSLVGKVHNSS